MMPGDGMNIKKRHTIQMKEKTENDINLDLETAMSEMSISENDFLVEDEYACCREFIFNVLYYITILLMLTIIVAGAFWSMGISIIFESIPFVTTVLFNAIFDTVQPE